MDIEFIKSEFEKLSLIIRTWNESESVSAIERDIALDKLKSIYDALRFGDAAAAVDEQTAPQIADAAPTIIVPAQSETESVTAEHDETPETVSNDETETETEEQEVEVEFIFAEEEAEEYETDEAPAEEPEITENVPKENSADEADETPAADSVVPAAPEQEEPRQDDAQPSRRPSNSLFGADEIGSRPRTKHHRMMSIYNDARPREEKVIDISKIFDDAPQPPQPVQSQQREHRVESTPESIATAAKEVTDRAVAPAPRPVASTAAESRQADEASHTVTLGDAINRNAQTLADTLAKPSALAEEITHTKIESLREAIGINDKFLMIRDLFDGDDEAYDEAIDALDGFDSLDDCMIHIVENYEWNPDSEGAKFIMQLLERKLS